MNLTELVKHVQPIILELILANDFVDYNLLQAQTS